MRAHEVMDLRGANDAIARATGWQPTIPFAQTMRDTIEWWERRLSETSEAVPGSVPH